MSYKLSGAIEHWLQSRSWVQGHFDSRHMEGWAFEARKLEARAEQLEAVYEAVGRLEECMDRGWGISEAWDDLRAKYHVRAAKESSR